MNDKRIKIGCKVKVINWGSGYSINDIAARDLGLTKFKDGNSDYFIQNERDTICKVVGLNEEYVGVLAPNGIEYVMGKDGLEFLSYSGKIPKPIVYKFALQYELDEDPTEYFVTMKDVKERIKELVEDEEDLKKDSIIVHEIKSSYPISLDLAIKGLPKASKKKKK